MRGLIILTFLIAAAWSGWWLIGTSAQQTAIENWMEQRRDEGWTAEVDIFEINGFPNRFDSNFSDLTLGNPHAGWTWHAPEFQILALSYKPNHIIAVWPGLQSYSTRRGTTTVTSDLFRGSLIFKPDTALSLDRMQLEVENLELGGSSDWQASATEASIAFFAKDTPDAPPNTYDLYVKALEFAPSAIWRNSVDQEGRLPETIPEVILDASLTYDNPWDRFAIEQTNPRLTTMEIRSLRFIWGDLALTGNGQIDVRSDGFIEGTFALNANKWRELMDVIAATNILSQEFATALERGLKFVAAVSGNPEDIEIPLRFTDGLTYIGAVPIGAAPRVY